MLRMRRFTTTYRLQGLSIPEIAGEFEETTVRLGRTHNFNGRKLKPGPLLNALVLRFLEMTEEERARIAGESLAKLEMKLAQTDQERAEAERKLVAVAPAVNDTKVVVNGPTDAPKRRRRGAG